MLSFLSNNLPYDINMLVQCNRWHQKYLYTAYFLFILHFSPITVFFHTKNVPRLYSIYHDEWYKWNVPIFGILFRHFDDFLESGLYKYNIIVFGASEPSFPECGWPADDLKRHICRELDPDPPRSSEQKLFLLHLRISCNSNVENYETV